MTPDSEVLDKINATLAHSSALYLSTCTGDTPWVAGAYFAHTNPFSLCVVLEGEGTTFHNLHTNPHFSVVVSTGSPFELFLQARGTATVRDAADLARAKQDVIAKVPESAGFLSAPIPMMAVDLHIEEWRATDVMHGWLPARKVSPSTPESFD